MKRFQVKGKETDELKQLYKNLQQYWDALKQSNPTKPSRNYSSPSNNSTIKPIELENNSPRYLMSMLQQDPSEAWMMMRTKDVASKEILRERWEAIESGKFKGRRLFVPMAEEEEECESDMNPNCEEVRSVSFCHSKDEHESSGSQRQQHQQQQQHHFTRECSYSSSTNSPCCLLGSSVDKDREHMVATVAETRVVANRGSYAVLFGGLAFAFLLLVAMCMSGGCDHQVILVPT